MSSTAELTTLQCFEYSFIALICLMLFIQNFINMRNYGHRTLSGMYLLFCVVALSLACLFEIMFGMREAGLLGSSDALGYAEEILYTITVIFAGYFWYVSSELYQNSPAVSTKARRVIVALPLFIMTACTLLTPVHHLNFYFENGHYIRGPFSFVFAVVMFALIAQTGIAALINSFRKRFYMERDYFRIIFLYAVLLLFFQCLQTVVGPILPFRTMGAALVMYFVQQKYIKENVYIDNMTGTNNRNAADRYIHNQIRNSDAALNVAMIDVDRFKEINDNYGHQAGDRALQLIAEAFMRNLTAESFFARYGGDEFLLINTSRDIEEIKTIVRNAESSLEELCRQEKAVFSLKFSCGITQKTPEMNTVPELLEAADENMYRIKRARHNVPME